MSESWKIIVTVINLIAVPLVAFVVRMFRGEVHNDNEKIISDFLIGIFQKRETHVANS